MLYKLAYALQVLHGRIPDKYPYSDAPVAVLQSLNDFVGSFRHALFDFIIPVFNLMQMFRMYTPEFLLIEATHQVIILTASPLQEASSPNREAAGVNSRVLESIQRSSALLEVKKQLKVSWMSLTADYNLSEVPEWHQRCPAFVERKN